MIEISATVVEETTWFDTTLITIQINSSENGAYFTDQLPVQAVQVGVASSWKLPEIVEDSVSLT